jgi:hypothetical protein
MMRFVTELPDRRTDMEREAAAVLSMQAMRLPGFVMLPGMRMLHRTFSNSDDGNPEDSVWALVQPRLGQGWPWFPDGYGYGQGIHVPDPDDPATAGCLLRLMGPVYRAKQLLAAQDNYKPASDLWRATMLYDQPGRAYMKVALELGQWPGGVK